jgi:hypothetical protein
MTDYLLDTNILLRISDGNAINHQLAGQATAFNINDFQAFTEVRAIHPNTVSYGE